MNENKHSFFAPSKLKAALIYITAIFILSLVFSIMMAFIVAKTRGIDDKELVGSFLNSNPVRDEVMVGKNIANGWANFLAYLVAFLGVTFFMRNDLITDYKSLTENKKKYSILIPICAVSFAGISVGIDKLFGLFLESSDNQKTIVELLKTSAAVPMIVSTVIFAPIVEELIYRKAIFSAFKAYSVIPAYITSIVLFTLPHMLSTSANIGIWLLQCLPYALCGFMLCLIYHKSNHNVYASIAAHMLNNLIAVIFVFIF